MSSMDLRLEYFSKYPRVLLHPIQPSWSSRPMSFEKIWRVGGGVEDTTSRGQRTEKHLSLIGLPLDSLFSNLAGGGRGGGGGGHVFPEPFLYLFSKVPHTVHIKSELVTTRHSSVIIGQRLLCSSYFLLQNLVTKLNNKTPHTAYSSCSYLNQRTWTAWVVNSQQKTCLVFFSHRYFSWKEWRWRTRKILCLWNFFIKNLWWYLPYVDSFEFKNSGRRIFKSDFGYCSG
jgi:hypothetical protein